MGQLYYAQTQLYSIVLGVKFSGQYALNIAIDYSLLGAHLFTFFSQILYQRPNQLIYTRGWRGSYARQVHSSTPVAEPALVQQDIAPAARNARQQSLALMSILGMGARCFSGRVVQPLSKSTCSDGRAGMSARSPPA